MKRTYKVRELLSLRIMKEIVGIYLFLFFVIYPLYYEDHYYNMGDAKWHFFKSVTYFSNPGGLWFPGAIIFFIACFIWYQVDLYRKGEIASYWNFKKTSVTDRFVLGYLIITVFSTIISPYKDSIIWGYKGWYMGLIAQIAFVLLYYFVSRFWRWDDLMITLYLGVSAVVFFLGVLHRFHIDPLDMYNGLDEKNIHEFLSTLGQQTWYSSYVCSLFPIGIFAYWYYEGKLARKLSTAYVILGFMTMITQNSDSSFYALVAFMSVLFFFSFDENIRMKRFIEIILIALLTWRVIGFFQIAFADVAVIDDGLMTFATQSALVWIVILAVGLFYALFVKLDNEGRIEVKNFKLIRRLYFIALTVGLVGGFVYIVLNSTGTLPVSLRSESNYLLFNDDWGNRRGISWTCTALSIRDSMTDDPVRFLFGAGPDGFYRTIYKYHGAELNNYFSTSLTLTCAHNEWMTAIVNEGLIGGILYLGIFISAIRRFGAKSVQCPELVAAAMCVAAYMAHNFFCYQQIICTPMIFIIIGAGECLARIGKKPIYEEY